MLKGSLDEVVTHLLVSRLLKGVKFFMTFAIWLVVVAYVSTDFLITKTFDWFSVSMEIVLVLSLQKSYFWPNIIGFFWSNEHTTVVLALQHLSVSKKLPFFDVCFFHMEMVSVERQKCDGGVIPPTPRYSCMPYFFLTNLQNFNKVNQGGDKFVNFYQGSCSDFEWSIASTRS